MEYDLNRPWLTLDEWQKEYIAAEGNCFLLCGRQSGKTTAMSIKIAECAIKEKEPCDYMVVAYTEKQAYNLFFKTLMYLESRYYNLVKRGKDKPTMHEINIKNGVCIMCHAVGQAGEGISGFTIKKLFVDEAAPMNREVFIRVSPMISVQKNGTMDLASTPRGKKGYFYECSKSDRFKKFYVSAEDCPRHTKEFLEDEKKRMSRLEYAQEYLAVFLDELRRYFSEDLVKTCCVLKRPEKIDKNLKHYMGVDIARMGEDEGTYEIIRKAGKDYFEQVENIVTTKKLTTETVKKIIELTVIYPFHNESIGIDAGSGSLGCSILDFCLDESSTKRKVVAINNRERILDNDGEQKKRILKEDLYDNLRALMEMGRIKLLDDDEIAASFASVQYEYVIKSGKMSTLRIFGDYTHIVEGLIRAAWLASKDKTLNIWAR